MARGQLDDILRTLRNRFVAKSQAHWSDGELVRRFTERHDEAAFAVLVDRYGRLVLQVCRSVLRRDADAEDAFQSTFLVLVKKAGYFRRSQSLASWLHGIAFRCASNLRTSIMRRDRREKKAVNNPAETPDSRAALNELLEMMHEEINRLAEKYRAPFILCFLEGKSRVEAAAALGWKEGTLSTRLAKAREILQRRMTARGITLSGAIGAIALGPTSMAASAPVALVQRTLAAAMVVASGATTAGLIPPHVAALAAGIGRAMFLTKVKIALVVLLAVGAISGAALEMSNVPRAAGAAEPAAQDALTSAQQTPATPPQASPEPAKVANMEALPQGAIARLGSLAFNHGERISGTHFTPDGKYVVTTGSDIIRIWDAESGQELRHFTMPNRQASLSESTLRNDGKTLVYLEDGERVRIVNLETGQRQERTLKNSGRKGIIYVSERRALSPNGEFAATFSPATICVHDVDSGATLCQIDAGAAKFSTASFAGNTRIVTAAQDQCLEVWDAKTGRSLRRLDQGAPAVHMVTSEDGQFLAVLEHHVSAVDRRLPSDTIHLWDLEKGERLHRLSAANSWIMQLRFDHKRSRLFARRSMNDGNVTSVWNVAMGQELDSPKGEIWFPQAFSPDGRRFISRRLVWDAERIVPINPENSPHAFAHKIWLSHSGDKAVVMGANSISTWDVSTGRRGRSFEVMPAFQASTAGIDRVISRDGRLAVTYRPSAYFPNTPSLPSHLVVWDVATGQERHTIHPDPKVGQWQTTFSPDAQSIALWVPKRGDNPSTVQIVNLKTDQPRRSFPEPKASFGRQMSYSSDGKSLIIYGDCVVGYDVKSGSEHFYWKIPRLVPDLSGFVTEVAGKIIESSPIRSVAFAPDAHLVACIQSTSGAKGLPDRTAFLFDDQTGATLFQWQYDGKNRFGVDEMEISADARLLAVTDGDVAHVFEVATGRKLHTLTGNRTAITRLAFSGNGRRLATAAGDWTILVWDVSSKTQDSKLDLKQCWADLLDDNASKAQAAVARMMDSSQAAAQFLSRHLKPAPQGEQEAIRQSLAKLDDASFAAREKATEHLRKLGRAAVPALRDPWLKPLSLESKRRVQSLLEAALKGPLTGESLRIWRALPILEHADEPECRRLLEQLAGGAPGAWLTEEARVSLIRANLRGH